MTLRHFLKTVGLGAALATVVLVGIAVPPRGQASGDNPANDEASEIKKGFEIAPVPLNLEGKNRALVGLGSYIVNAQGDCDGCHSAGPATEFAPGGTPSDNAVAYLSQYEHSRSPRHLRILEGDTLHRGSTCA